jgi:nitroimidazol reductase NimA-like FMN-containing flavoprotein (pyridoxamine 5'-phosphate oxidase superfamily)
MRRQDREIQGVEEKLRVINTCKVCRLGMAENNEPYIVPLNFGYEYENGALTLYFHSAREGKKIDILKNNPRVCFEMDAGHALIEGDTACGYGCAYESVAGFGRIEFLEEAGEKRRALNLLMKHQTGRGDFVFDDDRLNAAAVYKMAVAAFTGKRRAAAGY